MLQISFSGGEYTLTMSKPAFVRFPWRKKKRKKKKKRERKKEARVEGKQDDGVRGALRAEASNKKGHTLSYPSAA